jgi:hypothetical protein
MAGLLGDIFGAADTAKRKLRDVVANPLLSAQQFVGNMNDRARNLNEMTAAAALEGVDYGPASQRLGGLLAEGYNPVGMFIGPSSPMFNKQMAFEATKLSKRGKTPQEIWQQTGTVKGPDGQWRQEISDAESRFNLAQDIQARGKRVAEDVDLNKQLLKQTQQRSKQGKDLFPKELTQAKKQLKEQTEDMELSLNRAYGYSDPVTSGNLASIAMNHPELFKAYPELGNVIVKQGATSGADGTLGSLYGNLLNISSKGLAKDPRSTALHELQHAIQEREGFAVGGNTRDFAVMRNKALDSIGDLNTKMSEIAKKLENKSLPAQEQALLRSQYDQAMEARQGLVSNASIDPMQAYGNLMGEAEARLTQRRMNLNPQQRRQNFPFEYTGETGYGLDVQPSGLIYMDQSGTILDRGLLGR